MSQQVIAKEIRTSRSGISEILLEFQGSVGNGKHEATFETFDGTNSRFCYPDPISRSGN